jgi:hypothetical protein
MAGVMPGVYQLKAIETSFLPTLRENLRVGTRGRTEANLTLSTLIDALNWLPAQKRTPAEPEDDWTWTLRSAAYRPLLRYVGEDGVETLQTPETATHPLHGRLLIQTGTQAFAESGPSETGEYRRDDGHGTQTLVRSRVGNSPGAPTQLLAGWSRENAVGSGLTSVIAYRVDPEIVAGASSGIGTGSGMRILRLRSAETMRLAPAITAEAGSQMQMLALGAATATSISPFANVTWTHGTTSVGYGVTTAPGLRDADSLAGERSLLPFAVMRDGLLTAEHGLHQELKLEHADDAEGMSASVAVYADEVRTPIVDGLAGEGMGGAVASASENSLYDPTARTVRLAGPNYQARGVMITASHKGPAATRASLSLASGSALVSGRTSIAASPSFKPQSAEAAAVTLEGGPARTGTQWRGSYRWQPAGTVNAVDLFDGGVDRGMAEAYLSLFLRQSLHLSHIVPGGVDAVVDVRNLLAEGYHPFLTSDGGTLFFAQASRSVQGGLAFYF